MVIKAGWDQIEWIELEYDLDAAEMFTRSHLRGCGGPELLDLLEQYRPLLKGAKSDVAIPKGRSPAVLLMREIVLKLRCEYKAPYSEPELCHCRAVSTETVDQAIIYGADTPERVARQTSAGTGCGTCRGDVLKLIETRYREI